jgi:hypothetical protein
MVVFFPGWAVGLTVGPVSAHAKRKHERARIDRMNPNLAVLIISSPFPFWSFFNLFDQFAIKLIVIRHQLSKSLWPKV